MKWRTPAIALGNAPPTCDFRVGIFSNKVPFCGCADFCLARAILTARGATFFFSAQTLVYSSRDDSLCDRYVGVLTLSWLEQILLYTILSRIPIHRCFISSAR